METVSTSSAIKGVVGPGIRVGPADIAFGAGFTIGIGIDYLPTLFGAERVSSYFGDAISRALFGSGVDNVDWEQVEAWISAGTSQTEVNRRKKKATMSQSHYIVYIKPHRQVAKIYARAKTSPR